MGVVHEVFPAAGPVPPVVELVQLTNVTPTSSVAVPAIVTMFELVTYVVLVVGESMVTIGAVTSVKVTVMEAVAVFPAMSLAETVIGFTPGTNGISAVQVVVPVVFPEVPVRAFDHWMLMTPVLSEAIPAIARGVTVVLYDPPAGLVMEILGGVVS